MKRLSTFAATAALAFSAGVGAETAAQSNATYVDIARSSDSEYQFRASDVIGMDVINDAEEEIGEVDDVVFGDRESGPAAVISTGGFFGLNEKLVTVPASALKLSADREHVLLNLTEEQLGSLKEFHYIEGEKTWAELKQERQQIIAEERQEIAEARDELAEEKREADHAINDALWDQIAANWQQFKGKAQQQWGELTGDEIDQIAGQRDVLIGKLQERYGIDEDTAVRQADDWAVSL